MLDRNEASNRHGYFLRTVEWLREIGHDVVRLCRYFGLSEGYFLRLQNAYELMEAKRKLGQVVNEIEPSAS